MDKNTVIGLVLIAAIIVGFSIINRPSAEQMAQQRRIQDSLRQVETQKQLDEARSFAQDAATDREQLQNTVESFFNVEAPNVAAQDSTLSVPADSLLSAEPPVSFVQDAQMVALENEKIRLLLNPQGGRIESVQLKDYKRYDGDSLYLFLGDESRFNLKLFNKSGVELNTENHYFTPIVSSEGTSVTMRLQYTPQQYIDFVYTLPANEFMMDFDIRVAGMRTGLHPRSLSNFEINWEQKLRSQERSRGAFENRHSRIHYKYHKQDVEKMSDSKADAKELSEPVQWFAFKDHYFTSVIIAQQPFSNTKLASHPLQHPDYIKDYAAEVWAPVSVAAEGDLLTAGFNYYFGPVHYQTLKAYDKNRAQGAEKLEMKELVYLGYNWLSWINKYFTIPVFNFFLSLGWGMGLIIFLLTLMVKLIVSPLTFKSYMSSAKMRVLRPQIKAIEEKYPGQDKDMMLKRQQATMELYNKAGASPMSGCLPQLIQMPVFLALFFFFPSAIELRQQSFLWAHDLSTYDSIISWSGNIPFVTRFLGNHISLFCLLMTVVNVIYTRYTMQATDTGQAQMAGMKYMPIMMSVIMFFFLNSYPAGLNYYYFLSTLITIVLTFVFKWSVDEEKVLAQLEANKKKPRKQSGFMARLAEAQKMQEKQARERARENAKKNYRR